MGDIARARERERAITGEREETKMGVTLGKERRSERERDREEETYVQKVAERERQRAI